MIFQPDYISSPQEESVDRKRVRTDTNPDYDNAISTRQDIESKNDVNLDKNCEDLNEYDDEEIEVMSSPNAKKSRLYIEVNPGQGLKTNVCGCSSPDAPPLHSQPE